VFGNVEAHSEVFTCRWSERQVLYV
jgi:hypothetical protein